MSLKLNGATSGSIELDVPAAIGSDLNITIPGAAGTLDRLERAGNILQVVQNYITGTSSTTVNVNNTTAVTNFAQSITPTYASSKILVRVRWNGEYTSLNVHNMSFRLLRDGSFSGQPPSSGSRRSSISVPFLGYDGADAATSPDSTWFEYLDSANTTSTTTYQLAVISTDAGTLYTNRTVQDLDSVSHERLTSSITLIEVAA